MAKVSASVRAALNVVAHYVMADGMERSVPMPGFKGFYLKSLPAHQRAIVNEFMAAMKRAPRDLADMIEKDQGK